MTWTVHVRRGSAAALHGGEPAVGAGRVATWLEVDRGALVLGSAQSEHGVDRAACAEAGIDVVRRRSGGGAVLLLPGEMCWLDVVVPRGDPLWVDDVGRSMWWLGEVWAGALEDCGMRGAVVHRGPLVHTAWSRLVCFDGLGGGEVVVGGAKAVGISQRRTRAWARLQSSIHLAWRPELMRSLLAEPRPAPGELLDPVVAPVSAARLRAAVEARLGRVDG